MGLILGSVQFGVEYGITNHAGQPSLDTAFETLNAAWDAGIRVLDSAQAYGNANKVITEYHKHHKQRFSIINKVMRYPQKTEESAASLLRERDEMDIEKFDCVMFHYAGSVNSEVPRSFLEEFKKLGVADRIGLSIETTDDYLVLKDRFDFDVVQLPLNILSRNFMPDKFLEDLKQNNVEIHARSAFLQGLLLGNISDIPPYLGPLASPIQKFQKECAALGISPATGCFLFLLQSPSIAHIVTGAQNAAQLQEIIKAYEAAQNCKKALPWKDYAVDDFDLVHPSKWATLNQKSAKII